MTHTLQEEKLNLLENILRGISLIMLVCSWGCVTVQASRVEKELFSKQITNDRVAELKRTISNEGYKRISNENYPYEGAKVTQYLKKVNGDYKIGIYISFKNTDFPDINRNLGVTVYGVEYKNIPEINAEVDRMEEILYRKLLEVAGAENVKRAEEIYRRPKINWIPWRNKKSNNTAP